MWLEGVEASASMSWIKTSDKLPKPIRFLEFNVFLDRCQNALKVSKRWLVALYGVLASFQPADVKLNAKKKSRSTPIDNLQAISALFICVLYVLHVLLSFV